MEFLKIENILKICRLCLTEKDKDFFNPSSAIQEVKQKYEELTNRMVNLINFALFTFFFS